jgi:polyisoprenoid-binding protein YceI
MTIAASHETQGSFQGVAELSNDGTETALLLEWSATLNEVSDSGEAGIAFEFSSSATTLTFNGVFTSLEDLDDEDPTSTVVSTTLSIMDGDADFMGTLMLSNHDLTEVDGPDVFESQVVMAGMSGDVSFTLTFDIDEMGDDETLDVTLMIGDSGYMMKGTADNGADIMGSVWLVDYNYGDFMELSNGVVVTYIDDDEVEYVDLSFTIDE